MKEYADTMALMHSAALPEHWCVRTVKVTLSHGLMCVAQRSHGCSLSQTASQEPEARLNAPKLAGDMHWQPQISAGWLDVTIA